MARYAIVDLGSNTVRLVIFDVNARVLEAFKDRDKAKAKPSKLFSEILDEKKTAGLSAYVTDGIFSKRGIDKAAEILASFVRTAKDLGCKHTSIFATAVLRNCTNSAEAQASLEKSIDQRIHLLSEKLEAHLGYVGATFEKPIGDGTLIDIGGGSTELTVVRDGFDHHNISIAQGSVSSYAQFVKMILPTEKELDRIAKSMDKRLEELGDLSVYESEHAYGIGGSIRALCKLYAGLFADGKKVSVITAEQIEELLTELKRNPNTFAHQVTKSAPDRIHTVVPGTMIALSAMRAIGAKDLEVCKYGIREGYLIEKVLEL